MTNEDDQTTESFKKKFLRRMSIENFFSFFDRFRNNEKKMDEQEAKIQELQAEVQDLREMVRELIKKS